MCRGTNLLETTRRYINLEAEVDCWDGLERCAGTYSTVRCICSHLAARSGSNVRNATTKTAQAIDGRWHKRWDLHVKFVKSLSNEISSYSHVSYLCFHSLNSLSISFLFLFVAFIRLHFFSTQLCVCMYIESDRNCDHCGTPWVKAGVTNESEIVNETKHILIHELGVQIDCNMNSFFHSV